MSDHATTTMKYGAKIKTLKSYLMGLFLSLIFTFIAFALVGEHLLDTSGLYIAITVLAVAQLFAQVICFLRLNVSSEGQWNTMPFIFTFIIVGVLVGGSLWIMYNLNVNMM
ncbi:MAG: cytochrome o ubiquinol oxidase subunit IV [Gammaproteobacteria bacterium RIFCSPHIGHO2_02_FULL_39_13]|nr:MAG: cytochrome o ubiquinol oxidase subunit IV [Gammaproteobacteria bacterium RIFCSPHIGHO2_02_FULL_39_13]OGT48259.1 MAG: cytochrome o ubiquinol oxidase subunit IV [Gammaproteobacteria bacterium RIFCSPHIGHO2_12_FULL_39_24]